MPNWTALKQAICVQYVKVCLSPAGCGQNQRPTKPLLDLAAASEGISLILTMELSTLARAGALHLSILSLSPSLD